MSGSGAFSRRQLDTVTCFFRIEPERLRWAANPVFYVIASYRTRCLSIHSKRAVPWRSLSPSISRHIKRAWDVFIQMRT